MFIQILPICDEIVDITPQNVLDNYFYTDTKHYFKDFMQQRFSAKIMTYNHKINEWTWMDDEVYYRQLKTFRKAYKYKKLQILDCNLCQHMYNGKKWYSITIQPIDKTGEVTSDMCIGSCKIFNYVVSGYVYYYKHKTDRDNAYNYIMK